MTSGGTTKGSAWALVGIIAGIVLMLFGLLHLIATPASIAVGDGPATAGHVFGLLLFGGGGAALLVFGIQRRRRDLSQ